MLNFGLPSRPLKGCQNWFIMLSCLVFVAVAATAVYLSGLSTITSPRSSGQEENAKSSSRTTMMRSLVQLHPAFAAASAVTTTSPPTALIGPNDSGQRSAEAKTSKTVTTADGRPATYARAEWAERLVTPNITVQGESRFNGSVSASCLLPPGGFKAWKSGLVTVLEPVIQRDCEKLMAGDKAETRRIEAASKQWKNALTDTLFLKQTQSCFHLRKLFNNNLYNTVPEQRFPLAFIFVVNNSPQQVFRLLNLLYRPQNTFCIHYDVKSSQIVRQMFDNIAKCFSNMMIASKLEDVIWGYNTIMEAQMNCLRDLHRYRKTQPASTRWRYVVNLCGKELPLASNRELVLHFMALNGSSSIITSKASEEEVEKRIHFKAVLNKKRSRAVTSSILLGPPPFNLTIYKGSSYNAFSYTFVDFILNDSRVKVIHKFFIDCKNPEEHFYASVFMMPGIPGGFRKQLSEKKSYFRVARAIWCHNGRQCFFGFYCHGQVLRDVCITDSADLPSIMKSAVDGHMFHNKYFSEKDHTVMDCLEERIVSINKEEYNQECNSMDN